MEEKKQLQRQQGAASRPSQPPPPRRWLDGLCLAVTVRRGPAVVTGEGGQEFPLSESRGPRLSATSRRGAATAARGGGVLGREEERQQERGNAGRGRWPDGRQAWCPSIGSRATGRREEEGAPRAPAGARGRASLTPRIRLVAVVVAVARERARRRRRALEIRRRWVGYNRRSLYERRYGASACVCFIVCLGVGFCKRRKGIFYCLLGRVRCRSPGVWCRGWWESGFDTFFLRLR